MQRRERKVRKDKTPANKPENAESGRSIAATITRLGRKVVTFFQGVLLKQFGKQLGLLAKGSVLFLMNADVTLRALYAAEIALAALVIPIARVAEGGWRHGPDAVEPQADEPPLLPRMLAA